MNIYRGYITKGDIVRQFEIEQQEGSYRYVITMEPVHKGEVVAPFVPRTMRGLLLTFTSWENFGYTITWTEGEVKR